MAALDGFWGQTVPRASIEVLVVSSERPRLGRQTKHPRLALHTIAWPRRGHLAAAINAAAAVARGSIVAVIDPQWRPHSRLAEYCQRFHEQETHDGDVIALATRADPSHADDLLLWWMHAQRFAGLDALSPGVHSWRGLRFDAVSFKRALLLAHPIPDARGDEVLMRSLWAQRAPIRVFSESIPVLTTVARADLRTLLAREYRAAYARLHAMLASPQTFAGESVDDRFQHPEKYRLSTPDRRELSAAIADLTRELSGVRPLVAVGTVAERLALLGRLYLAAVSHARSAGWLDAKAGRRMRPPH